jgi:hypothetical protein
VVMGEVEGDSRFGAFPIMSENQIRGATLAIKTFVDWAPASHAQAGFGARLSPPTKHYFS